MTAPSYCQGCFTSNHILFKKVFSYDLNCFRGWEQRKNEPKLSNDDFSISDDQAFYNGNSMSVSDSYNILLQKIA